jgi:hypothetical protein
LSIFDFLAEGAAAGADSASSDEAASLLLEPDARSAWRVSLMLTLHLCFGSWSVAMLQLRLQQQRRRHTPAWHSSCSSSCPPQASSWAAQPALDYAHTCVTCQHERTRAVQTGAQQHNTYSSAGSKVVSKTVLSPCALVSPRFRRLNVKERAQMKKEARRSLACSHTLLK